MSHRLLEFGRIMVTRDSSRKRHAPTPTPLHLAGAWGRHRLAHGLVNGRSSITHKQTETACIIVACMISAAPLVSTVTCYGSSKNFPANVSVETPPWICLYACMDHTSCQSMVYRLSYLVHIFYMYLQGLRLPAPMLRIG